MIMHCWQPSGQGASLRFATYMRDRLSISLVQVLVVDQTYRGRGTRRAMMAAAEAQAIEQGFTSVALTSHVARAEAHRFYEKLGYQPMATSHLFRKSIGIGPTRGRATTDSEMLRGD
jgi:GNAT superfamily N-acetyltransferase